MKEKTKLTEEELQLGCFNGMLANTLFDESYYESEKTSKAEAYCQDAGLKCEYGLSDIEKAFRSGAEFTENHIKKLGNDYFKGLQKFGKTKGMPTTDILYRNIYLVNDKYVVAETPQQAVDVYTKWYEDTPTYGKVRVKSVTLVNEDGEAILQLKRP